MHSWFAGLWFWTDDGSVLILLSLRLRLNSRRLVLMGRVFRRHRWRGSSMCSRIRVRAMGQHLLVLRRMRLLRPVRIVVLEWQPRAGVCWVLLL